MIPGDRLPTLESERVRLRWLEERDVPALFELFSHADVTRYWSHGPLRQQSEAAALLTEIHACFRDQSLFQWGVARLAGDDVIGTCTLASIDPQNQRAEIGFALAPAHWGTGVMHEVLMRLIAFAFNELDIRRLEADVDPRNSRAIGLLERLGFIKEGLLLERWQVEGQICDSVILGLLRREWRAARSEPGCA